MTQNNLELHPPLNEMLDVWNRLVIAVRITGEVSVTVAGYKANVPAVVEGERIIGRFTSPAHFHNISSVELLCFGRQLISRFTEGFGLGKKRCAAAYLAQTVRTD